MFRLFMYFQIALHCSIIITSIFHSPRIGLLVSFQSRLFCCPIVASVTSIHWSVSQTVDSPSDSILEFKLRQKYTDSTAYNAIDMNVDMAITWGKTIGSSMGRPHLWYHWQFIIPCLEYIFCNTTNSEW